MILAVLLLGLLTCYITFINLYIERSLNPKELDHAVELFVMSSWIWFTKSVYQGDFSIVFFLCFVLTSFNGRTILAILNEFSSVLSLCILWHGFKRFGVISENEFSSGSLSPGAPFMGTELEFIIASVLLLDEDLFTLIMSSWFNFGGSCVYEFIHFLWIFQFERT